MQSSYELFEFVTCHSPFLDKHLELCLIIQELVTILTFIPGLYIAALAQEEAQTERKPARPAFESQVLIDNQTVVIPTKNTFEWDIQHRFGVIENGYDDLFGFYAASNIRLGFTYNS